MAKSVSIGPSGAVPARRTDHFALLIGGGDPLESLSEECLGVGVFARGLEHAGRAEVALEKEEMEEKQRKASVRRKPTQVEARPEQSGGRLRANLGGCRKERNDPARVEQSVLEPAELLEGAGACIEQFRRVGRERKSLQRGAERG